MEVRQRCEIVDTATPLRVPSRIVQVSELDILQVALTLQRGGDCHFTAAICKLHRDLRIRALHIAHGRSGGV